MEGLMQRLLAIGMALVVLASACQSGPTSTTSDAAPAGQPAPGGRLTQGIAYEITSIQPILSGDGSAVVGARSIRASGLERREDLAQEVGLRRP